MLKQLADNREQIIGGKSRVAKWSFLQTQGSLLLYLIKQSITPPLSGRAEELELEGETDKADKNLAENKHTTQTCKMSRINNVTL